MREIWMNGFHRYPIYIGENLLDNLKNYLPEISQDSSLMIITDLNVSKLYLNKVSQLFESLGYQTLSLVLEPGEGSKNFSTYQKIINFLSEHEITRGDYLLSLGGGVITDLAGFVASTYLRGIPFIQIPTTLLAMVDASIGGKTGINTSFGKNQVGSFYTPECVIMDTNFLETLSEKEWKEGSAEIIKVAMIQSPKLWSLLSDFDLKSHLEEVIWEAILVKKRLVEEDEFDQGKRQLLNFGHTLGHGLEVKSEYQISHGEAVAIGMRLIINGMVSQGLCENSLKEQLDCMLKKYGLYQKTPFRLDDLMTYLKKDKKRSGQNINLILVDKIGHGFIKNMNIDEVDKWLTVMDY